MLPFSKSLPGQFDYILKDIKEGLELPDHFAEDEEAEEEECTYTRWWEQDGASNGKDSAKRGKGY
jgi:hypothetical protein